MILRHDPLHIPITTDALKPFGGAMFKDLARQLKTSVHQHLIAMIPQVDRYLKLKRQAMQLMLNGDVERYMRTLRLISRLTVQ